MGGVRTIPIVISSSRSSRNSCSSTTTTTTYYNLTTNTTFTTVETSSNCKDLSLEGKLGIGLGLGLGIPFFIILVIICLNRRYIMYKYKDSRIYDFNLRNTEPTSSTEFGLEGESYNDFVNGNLTDSLKTTLMMIRIQVGTDLVGHAKSARERGHESLAKWIEDMNPTSFPIEILEKSRQQYKVEEEV